VKITTNELLQALKDAGAVSIMASKLSGLLHSFGLQLPTEFSLAVDRLKGFTAKLTEAEAELLIETTEDTKDE